MQRNPIKLNDLDDLHMLSGRTTVVLLDAAPWICSKYHEVFLFQVLIKCFSSISLEFMCCNHIDVLRQLLLERTLFFSHQSDQISK